MTESIIQPEPFPEDFCVFDIIVEQTDKVNLTLLINK